jgi:hypothetical protein
MKFAQRKHKRLFGLAVATLVSAGAVAVAQQAPELPPFPSSIPTGGQPSVAQGEGREQTTPETIQEPDILPAPSDGQQGTQEAASAASAVGASEAVAASRNLTANTPIEELEKLLSPEELARLDAQPKKQVRLERRGSSVVLGFLDRGLNKASSAKVVVGGKPAQFGTLSVAVKSCYRNGPDYPPENWAFLEITDGGRAVRERLATLGPRAENRRAREAGTTQARVVKAGWMNSSSPSIDALDHPIYDVWIKSCDGDGSPPVRAAERPISTVSPNEAASSASSMALSPQVSDQAPANDPPSPEQLPPQVEQERPATALPSTEAQPTTTNDN